MEDGLRSDSKVLLITATQSGTTVSYSFDFSASCVDSNPPISVTTVGTGCGSLTNTLGQLFTLLSPTYDCETGVIRFNTTGATDQPLSSRSLELPHQPRTA